MKMPPGIVFVCDCGTRLRVFADGSERSIIPCPNRSCRTRHLVSGKVQEVRVEQNGQWVDYDWRERDDVPQGSPE
jgi:hypothetical protein